MIKLSMFFDVDSLKIYLEFSDVPLERKRKVIFPNVHSIEEAELVVAAFPQVMITDQGYSMCPRYSIIRTPVVDDEVYCCKGAGDILREGTITRISATRKVITLSTGDRYYRQAESKYWTAKGKTLVLADCVQ